MTCDLCADGGIVYDMRNPCCAVRWYLRQPERRQARISAWLRDKYPAEWLERFLARLDEVRGAA